jgi:hypothetical protein
VSTADKGDAMGPSRALERCQATSSGTTAT